MKKIFLIAAAAALVLSSCSKSTVSEDTSDVNAIGFGTYSGTATKADASLVNGTKLAAGSFGVYGYITTGANWSTGASPAFMTNQAVAFDGASTYTYSPKRYWPKDETNLLSFYGYYPLATSTNGITPSLTKTSTGLGTYTFAVASASENQVDFMVSNLAKDLTWSNAGTATGSGKNGLVKLTFKHMLTQVNVKFATTADNDTKVKIKEVTFKNIKNAGTLTVADETPSDSWWDITGTPSAFKVTLSDGAGVVLPTLSTDKQADKTLIVKGDYSDVTTTDGALLLLPKSFTTDGGTTDGQIEIKYEYTTTVGSEEVTTSDKVTAYLTTAWKMNDKVTYYILLDLNSRAIEFTADVTNWTPVDGGTFTF
jgi:hypothetical protein